ncbi:MAG: Si-specific NAD(P)(+) transhydrogenase [Chloroflexi bacterium]|nr:Si-specific NAD(P)(+) transhydrogenase [Chloroflexota bacterium]
MPADTYDYDLIVIGSGPAGQRAAIQAAKVHKRVAVVEKKSVIGGVSVNIGTIPSKTLREAVMHLSGYRQRELYGASYKVKSDISMEDLLFRVEHVVKHEIDITRHQLDRNDVELISADAELAGPHEVRLKSLDRSGERVISAAYIVLAVGTSATEPDGFNVDGQHIFLSDDIPHMWRIPKSLAVVGGGVIGCEYATIFAALGVRVILIDKRERLLPFVDHEIIDALSYQMRQQRMVLRLGEEVEHIEVAENDHGEQVRITLRSGKQVTADMALYSIGRTGATAALNLEAAGLKTDGRGRLGVNEHYQTEAPHIYAVGDVIGFPSLASTSMEQGRMAACHAFNVPSHSVPELFPYGIYTIPEISMVGPTEQELTEKGVPYQEGVAHYREIARGQILGDHSGLLKLIFHLETRKLLGVHIIGEGASELVHIGQAVLAHEGSIDYFINNVFNYPTLAECYKTAAFDGINRLS